MNKKDQLIYSMLLGDGWLCKKDLRIQHSEKQLNYLKWKRKLLIKEGIDCGTIKYRNNNGFPAFYFYTKSYSFIESFKKKNYNPDKTACVLNNLNNLTPFSIAVWYMDDGSKCGNSNFYLNTQQYSLSDQKKLIDKLESLGLKDNHTVLDISDGFDQMPEGKKLVIDSFAGRAKGDFNNRTAQLYDT